MVPSSEPLMMASSELWTIAAIRSAASNAARCSLRSRAIVDAPTTTPSASWIGETVSETGTDVPSFRTRTASRYSTCWPALILARTALISRVRSTGLRRSMDLPMTFALELPALGPGCSSCGPPRRPDTHHANAHTTRSQTTTWNRVLTGSPAAAGVSDRYHVTLGSFGRSVVSVVDEHMLDVTQRFSRLVGTRRVLPQRVTTSGECAGA